MTACTSVNSRKVVEFLYDKGKVIILYVTYRESHVKFGTNSCKLRLQFAYKINVICCLAVIQSFGLA